MSGPLNGSPKPGAPEPPRPPRQTSSADLPPIRRLLVFLYLLAGLCVLLAVFLWWRIVR